MNTPHLTTAFRIVDTTKPATEPSAADLFDSREEAARVALGLARIFHADPAEFAVVEATR